MKSEKIKPLLYPFHRRLIRVLLKLQFIERLIEHSYQFLKFPP